MSHELHESHLSAVYVHVKQNHSQILKTTSILLFALHELYESHFQKKCHLTNTEFTKSYGYKAVFRELLPSKSYLVNWYTVTWVYTVHWVYIVNWSYGYRALLREL